MGLWNDSHLLTLKIRSDPTEFADKWPIFPSHHHPSKVIIVVQKYLIVVSKYYRSWSIKIDEVEMLVFYISIGKSESIAHLKNLQPFIKFNPTIFSKSWCKRQNWTDTLQHLHRTVKITRLEKTDGNGLNAGSFDTGLSWRKKKSRHSAEVYMITVCPLVGYSVSTIPTCHLSQLPEIHFSSPSTS